MQWSKSIAASFFLVFFSINTWATDYPTFQDQGVEPASTGSTSIPASGTSPAISYPSIPASGTNPMPDLSGYSTGDSEAYPSFDSSEITEAKTSAGSSGGTAKDIYGSSSGLNSQAAVPLTSSDKTITPINGTASGSIQLSQTSTNDFLTLVIMPGAGGEITTLIASQDLDMDGSIDFNYTPPFNISGVCSNGFMSCNPGTWDDCVYYKWEVASDNKLNVAISPSSLLGGCYCTNNSCGTNLALTNIEPILKDLGGGAAGALTEANPSYMITRSEINTSGMEIAFYGQDLGADRTMADGSVIDGKVTETKYYENTGALESDASTLAATEVADSSSAYAAVTTLSNQQQMPECSVERNVSLVDPPVSEIVVPMSGTGQVLNCGTDCIDIVLGKVGDNYWSGACEIFEENFSIYVIRPELIQSATLRRAKWDDYIQVWVDSQKVWSGPNENFPPETTGACELSTSWNQYPNLDVTKYFLKEGLIDTKIRVSVTGEGEGYAYVRLQLFPNCVATDTISDECATLDARTDCTLKTEEVDGVVTYQGGSPTGLIPLASSQTISEGTCIETLTYDWWLKKRTYVCDAEPASDLTGIYNRVVTVEESTQSPDSNTITYSDERLDPATGTLVSESGTISLTTPDIVPDCEFVCKTRRIKSSTDVTISSTADQERSGAVSDTLEANETYEFVYKVCEDNTCPPLEAGEELIKDCQCINEFAETTAILEALNQAGKDIICSDGEKK